MVITQYKKDSYKEKLIYPGVTGFPSLLACLEQQDTCFILAILFLLGFPWLSNQLSMLCSFKHK